MEELSLLRFYVRKIHFRFTVNCSRFHNCTLGKTWNSFSLGSTLYELCSFLEIIVKKLKNRDGIYYYRPRSVSRRP